MKVLLILEAIFSQTPDGRVWTSGTFTPSFFARYLTVFSAVVVGARVRPTTAVPGDYHVLDDPRISFAAIPWYRGLLGYLRERRRVVTALRRSLEQADAVILRVPSPLAGRLQPWLEASGRPFAVEVVGDPWDVFAPGVIQHPLRPFLRHRLRAEMKRQCLGACTAAYVTASTLQQRYSTKDAAPRFSYSSIELGEEAFISAPRPMNTGATPLRLVSVGTMSQRYKGQDVLLRAVAESRERGNDMQVVLVGDGVERSGLELLCKQLQMTSVVRFTGHLGDRGAVLAELDRNDAFIMPSRTEGLPRAMIEAMARGLPCLGTRVGGIPELLGDDALLPVDDHRALARAIDTRLRDPAWMAAASARNLSLARTYHQDLLRERRLQFYRAVFDATARWQAKN
ncbi:MAG: glycosyltransferase family 4 protein [Planctomycetes bacterium]|nr:glycosyltransferase family 4 protein [Planctomycetota bacterium]